MKTLDDVLEEQMGSGCGFLHDYKRGTPERRHYDARARIRLLDQSIKGLTALREMLQAEADQMANDITSATTTRPVTDRDPIST